MIQYPSLALRRWTSSRGTASRKRCIACSSEAVAEFHQASEGEHAIADAVNRVHSLVLSRTNEKIPWDNAELLMVRDDDDLREAIHAAKHQPGRDIGVPGGIRTAQAFARLGLIDEYVFMMHPVALGEGQRIFSRRTDLDLHSVKAYRSGVTRLICQPR